MGKTQDYLNSVEKEEGLGGDRYKFKEGDNYVRVLTMPVHAKSVFTENNSTRVAHKFVCYILDRDDNSEVKLMFMPYTIFRTIADYEDDRHYNFQDYPMPYDINVKAKNAGKKEVEYTILPVPEKTPLTASEQQAFDEAMAKKPIGAIAEKINLKAEEKELEAGIADAGVSPQEAQAHNERQAIINRAEMNPGYGKLKAEIAIADEAGLQALENKIEEYSAMSMFDEGITGLLKEHVAGRRAVLGGQDINVEDIPF